MTDIERLTYWWKKAKALELKLKKLEEALETKWG